MRDTTATRFRCTPRLVIGLGIMALGALYLLENLGILDAERVVRYWPVILVAVGLAKLLQPTPGESVFGAWAWLLVGGLLLGDRLGLPSVSRFWPLVLLLVGGAIASKAFGAPRAARAPVPSRPGDDDYVKSFALMSGVKRAITSREFRGGDAVAVMGGVELDLRQAHVLREDAVVDCFAFWGGIDIKVPEDWQVVNRGFAFMGGFEDNTRQPAEVRGRLVLTGIALMGGVEVKN